MGFFEDIRNFAEDTLGGAGAGFLLGGPLGAVGGGVAGAIKFTGPNKGNRSQLDLVGQSATWGALAGVLAYPSLTPGKALNPIGPGVPQPSFSSLLQGQIQSITNGTAYGTANLSSNSGGILGKGVTLTENLAKAVTQPGALTTALISAFNGVKSLVSGATIPSFPVQAPAIPGAAGGTTVVPVPTLGKGGAPAAAGFDPTIAILIVAAVIAAFWIFKRKK